MALNPPLDERGQPKRVQGEHYILSRKWIEFQLNIDGIGKLKGKGDLILTSQRLVFLNSRGTNKDKVTGFDIPLALTFQESFEQPIFGANYVKGKCKPLVPNSMPGDP